MPGPEPPGPDPGDDPRTAGRRAADRMDAGVPWSKEWEMESFERSGLIFPVVDAGPADGETVVLLHGFPQSPSSWDDVVPLLHAAGLRTLVPAQRGYLPA